MVTRTIALALCILVGVRFSLLLIHCFIGMNNIFSTVTHLCSVPE